MEINGNEWRFKSVLYSALSGSSLMGIDAKLLANKVVELEELLFKKKGSGDG